MHQRLAAALAPPPADLVPLRVGPHVVGWLNDARAARAARFTKVFARTADGLELVPALTTEPARTQAMADVTRTLADEKLLTAWRNEEYDVAPAFVEAPLLRIERAAARYFGIVTYAAHVNGLLAHYGELAMWLARRSRTKSIDPGQLDNLVAGGIRHGTTVAETVRREAWEEAGIGAPAIDRVQAVGVLQLCRVQADGVQREVIFTHDLRLAGDFRPLGIDGESVDHRHVTLAEAAALIANASGPDVVTLDASLVILDCMFRHGIVAPDSRYYLPLARLRTASFDALR